MRNLLTSFDEFHGNEILSERDMQDYQSRYNDLYEEWKSIRESGEKENINDDIVFEIELIKQVEINIDYILLLVKKYHDSHGEDKEILDFHSQGDRFELGTSQQKGAYRNLYQQVSTMWTDVTAGMA